MKALLLVAGRGTRISRYLSGNPKCTVDIGGDKKLIQYTVELLNKKGITDIGLVLGYNGGVIQEVLKDYDVKYFTNPFYDVTNSVASAWFAKDFLADYDDTIIMNGDVFVEEELLDEILLEQRSPVMIADSSRKEEADYKFYYENDILLKYGKELTGSDITGEYVGIGKFSKEFMKEFLDQMNDMINNQQHSVWWENIVYNMVGHRDVYIKEVNGKFWAEVDYIEDYERIMKFRGAAMPFPVNKEL